MCTLLLVKIDVSYENVPKVCGRERDHRNSTGNASGHAPIVEEENVASIFDLSSAT